MWLFYFASTSDGHRSMDSGWFVGRYVTGVVISAVDVTMIVVQTLVCWSVCHRVSWFVGADVCE